MLKEFFRPSRYIMEIFEKIILAIVNTSLWEWVAVFTGILYVILISYKKISAWFFAILSSLIYIYVCYTSRLYLESGLQVFYLVMGVYGWIIWAKGKTQVHQPITKWKMKSHLVNIGISSGIMLILGFIFDNYTNQSNPFTDAFTTVFSLAATYMVTKKVLENWIYWIIIDAVSIYLFASRELYLTSALFTLFTGIAIFGYFKWRSEFKQQMA